MASWATCIVKLLTLLFPLVVSSSTTCYRPDGRPAPEDFPCLPGEGHSFCCGLGYACASNKICLAGLSGGPSFNRGTCTDRSWSSPECPGFCVGKVTSIFLYNTGLQPPLTTRKRKPYCSSSLRGRRILLRIRSGQQILLQGCHV
jgi:hypothetical protein